MSKHDDILTTTCRLMETQGFHATGVNQILLESGAPRGSLYYYFPDGKTALAAAAIERMQHQIEQRIQTEMAAADNAAVGVRDFLLRLAGYVVASNYASGGPITAIALEVASTNERLNKACQRAYVAWQAAFAAALEADHYDKERAGQLSALIIAAIEGATLLARTQRSTVPLEAAAHQLFELLKR